MMKLVKLLAVVLLGTAQLAFGFGSEEDLANAVRSSYNFRSAFREGVQVTSQNGVVTLSGSVPGENFKALAAETAAATPGVSRVENRLEVALPEEKSDAWIKAQLLTRMLLGRDVAAAGMAISVKDGVVTLTGKADNLVEMNLAGIYAKEVPGVKEVQNQLEAISKVASTNAEHATPVDDASLAGLVKFALLSHKSTLALNPKVTAKDGAVTIEGEAASGMLKNFVSLLTETLRGVKGVTNNLSAPS
jgi:hyperosmotically inducible periplasmic protein